MPQSESRSRAVNEYRKRSVRSFNLRFYPADADLLEWFESRPEKARYLRELIRRDMEGSR